MLPINSLFSWVLLLSFALLTPITLPAGGASKSNYKICKSDGFGPIIAGNYFKLRSSPSLDAPSLRVLTPGTPLRILRVWHSPQGNDWMHVQISSFEVNKFAASSLRGWLKS